MKSVPFRRKLRIQFLKWHRTGGVAAALFVILLSVTGILLNHGNDLALDRTSIPKSWLGLYGIDIQSPETGYSSANQWAVFMQEQLYLGGQSIGECSKSLVGMVKIEQQLFAACERNLYLMTASGGLIESDTFDDDRLLKVGVNGHEVFIKGAKNLYRFDPDEFEFSQVLAADVTGVDWSASEPLPEVVAENAYNALDISEITWERFLLDLHSGRLFGNLSVWFVDLIGVVIIILALSGVWLRISRPKR